MARRNAGRRSKRGRRFPEGNIDLMKLGSKELASMGTPAAVAELARRQRDASGRKLAWTKKNPSHSSGKKHLCEDCGEFFSLSEIDRDLLPDETLCKECSDERGDYIEEMNRTVGPDWWSSVDESRDNPGYWQTQYSRAPYGARRSLPASRRNPRLPSVADAQRTMGKAVETSIRESSNAELKRDVADFNIKHKQAVARGDETMAAWWGARFVVAKHELTKRRRRKGRKVKTKLKSGKTRTVVRGAWREPRWSEEKEGMTWEEYQARHIPLRNPWSY